MSIFKLTSYLSRRNLQYLSVIFRIILNPSEASYHSLWERFDQILPEGSSSIAKQKLDELRIILEDYRTKKAK